MRRRDPGSRRGVVSWRWRAGEWRPQRTFHLDNGPRHAVGFAADTFVDITPQWPRSVEWLGRLMALVRDESYVPGTIDEAVGARETLVHYRGATCGVEYAEAFKAVDAYPQILS